MKKAFLSILTIFVVGSAYAQLNTFKEGDVISAEQMNQNFESLINSNLLRSTAVNCDQGETINGAIEQGFNDITVSGTCNENLDFTVWRDSAVDGRTPNEKLAPRHLKLSSGSTPGVIVDASSNTRSTITVTNGSTLILENISVQGGTHTVYATRNSNLLMTGGVTIEGFTERGIRIEDSSYLGVDEGGVTITGGTGAGRGVFVGMGSSAWIHTSNISNVEQGMTIYGGSYVLLCNFTIEASKRGIAIGDHSTVVRHQDGAGLITGTSDRAINAWQGNFYNWSPGSLTIQNLQGGQGIAIGRGGSSYIANLKMLDFDSTGSDWSPAINVEINSTLELEGAEISGSTDNSLIQIAAHSGGGINNSIITATSAGTAIKIDSGSAVQVDGGSTITVASAGVGIEVGRNSLLNFLNSTITGTATDGALVSISQGSTAEVRDSTISLASNEDGMRVSANSWLNIRNSTISGSTINGGTLLTLSGGSSSEVRDSTLTIDTMNRAISIEDNSGLSLRNSTLSGTATEELVIVSRNSNMVIRNESTLSKTASDFPDIFVSQLSFLNVWNNETPINSVYCYNKGYVGASEGMVTVLAPSCTE